LLQAGRAGVKAGDPTALALLGAPAPMGASIPGESIDDLSYLEQLFALDNGAVRSVYDALSAHSSGFSNPPTARPRRRSAACPAASTTDPSFFAFYRVGPYRDLIVQQGEANKKIWFTEFGYCSNPTPPPGYQYCSSIDATIQANFLVQAFQMARNLDCVAGMMEWNMNFQLAVSQTDEKWGFGVVRDDWTGRPTPYSARTPNPKKRYTEDHGISRDIELTSPIVPVIFANRAQANRAVVALRQIGIAREVIGLVAPARESNRIREDAERDVAKGAGRGAAIGGPLGAIGGMSLFALTAVEIVGTECWRSAHCRYPVACCGVV
jgi:hypothetical protein